MGYKKISMKFNKVIVVPGEMYSMAVKCDKLGEAMGMYIQVLELCFYG